MGKKPNNSPLEHFPDHVRAIGMITIEMANLEVALVKLIASILRISEPLAAMLVFTPKSTRARAEMVLHVSQQTLIRSEAQRAKRVVKRALTALAKRNDIVHEVWGVSQDRKQVLRSPVPYGKAKPIKLEDLTTEINTIRCLHDEIIELTQQLRLRPHYIVNFTY